MSSTTGANKGDNPSEFYPTPSPVTRAMLRRLKEHGRFRAERWGECAQVLDPCAGRGAILHVVRQELPRAVTYGFEIEPSLVAAGDTSITVGDALTRSDWRTPRGERPQLILTNPPFSLTLPFLERALAEVAPGGLVVFLLRLCFAAGQERAAFHAAHPSDMDVLARRPSFAASAKCKRRPGRKGGAPGEVGCPWKRMYELTATIPKTCPVCGAGVDVTRSDSSEYAWFSFENDRHPPRPNRWAVLECPADPLDAQGASSA